MEQVAIPDDRGPQHPVREVAVDDLLLDSENPRLRLYAPEQPTQEDLLRVLWTQMAVNEIALSVASNGWFENERLLGTSGPEAGTYIVVEGNRRLAAVKLLRDRSLRRRICGDALEAVAVSSGPLPDKLLVEEWKNSQELWRYLGFEHVNGAKAWDSFSKAAYVARVHDDYNEDLDAIARSIGDRHATVKRLYRGYAVLQQAEREAGFSRENAYTLYFSHLYTGLDYPQFQAYLGITRQSEFTRSPVPADKLPNLTTVMGWLYGDKTRSLKPVVERQNPHLKQLRQVLGDRAATETLERTRDLKSSFAVAYGEGHLFEDALYDAYRKARYAMSLVATAYDGAPEVHKLVEDTLRTLNDLSTLMKDKVDSRSSATGET